MFGDTFWGLDLAIQEPPNEGKAQAVSPLWKVKLWPKRTPKTDPLMNPTKFDLRCHTSLIYLLTYLLAYEHKNTQTLRHVNTQTHKH